MAVAVEAPLPHKGNHHILDRPITTNQQAAVAHRMCRLVNHGRVEAAIPTTIHLRQPLLLLLHAHVLVVSHLAREARDEGLLAVSRARSSKQSGNRAENAKSWFDNTVIPPTTDPNRPSSPPTCRQNK